MKCDFLTMVPNKPNQLSLCVEYVRCTFNLPCLILYGLRDVFRVNVVAKEVEHQAGLPRACRSGQHKADGRVVVVLLPRPLCGTVACKITKKGRRKELFFDKRYPLCDVWDTVKPSFKSLNRNNISIYSDLNDGFTVMHIFASKLRQDIFDAISTHICYASDQCVENAPTIKFPFMRKFDKCVGVAIFLEKLLRKEKKGGGSRFFEELNPQSSAPPTSPLTNQPPRLSCIGREI